MGTSECSQIGATLFPNRKWLVCCWHEQMTLLVNFTGLPDERAQLDLYHHIWRLALWVEIPHAQSDVSSSRYTVFRRLLPQGIRGIIHGNTWCCRYNSWCQVGFNHSILVVMLASQSWVGFHTGFVTLWPLYLGHSTRIRFVRLETTVPRLKPLGGGILYSNRMG